jgi:hypothetical protein
VKWEKNGIDSGHGAGRSREAIRLFVDAIGVRWQQLDISISQPGRYGKRRGGTRPGLATPHGLR